MRRSPCSPRLGGHRAAAAAAARHAVRARARHGRPGAWVVGWLVGWVVGGWVAASAVVPGCWSGEGASSHLWRMWRGGTRLPTSPASEPGHAHGAAAGGTLVAPTHHVHHPPLLSNDSVSSLPSPKQGMPTERRQGASKAAAESAAALAAGQRRKVLVVFIGGVTYAEVCGMWKGHGVRFARCPFQLQGWLQQPLEAGVRGRRLLGLPKGWCSSAVPPLGVPADLAFGVPSSLPHRCRHCASSARRGSATATSLWHQQRCAPAAACWPAWWQRGRSWRQRRERHAGPCKTLSSLGFQTEESVARLDHNAPWLSRRRRFRPAAAAAAAPPALLATQPARLRNFCSTPQRVNTVWQRSTTPELATEVSLGPLTLALAACNALGPAPGLFRVAEAERSGSRPPSEQ